MDGEHEHPLAQLVADEDWEGVLDYVAAARARADQRQMALRDLLDSAEAERLREVISEALSSRDR